jgi:hypothetical protein
MSDAIYCADTLVAKPTDVVTFAGYCDAQGPYVRMSMEFETFAWPGWKTGQVLDIEAVVADLRLRIGGRELLVGLCPAVPGMFIRPPSADRHKGDVAFLLRVDGAMYERLEDFRSGNDLMLEANLVFQLHVDGRGPKDNLFPHVRTTFEVPGKKWTAALAAAGFDEHLWIDVPLARSGRLSTTAARVRDALAARNSGHSDVCVSTARLAVDAIPQGGFGGRLPKDVHAFLTKNSTTMTKRERVAALRAAIYLLLSPAHHGDREAREEFSRADATTALALVSSLAALTESLGPEAKDPTL